MQIFCKPPKSIYKAILLLLAFTILSPQQVLAAEKKKFVVVIDAGHGGNDVGANENDVMEKDVNLEVALKLGELIKKKLKDTQVVYTRDKDVFISLQKRADIANSAKADLFVSIHCNSVDRSNKNRSNVLGATTYILGHHKDADNLAVAQRENSVVELDANDKAHFSSFDDKSDESHIIFEMTQKKNFQNSARFASAVQKEMVGAGRYSRGVQQAGFWVLWSTAMPAALVELDFICNPEQAKFLKSKEGQDKLAGAIFNAVKSYESYFRKNLGAQLDGSFGADEISPADAAMAREDAAPAASESVATVVAELPSSPSQEVRRHREETQKKTVSNAGHRRRSKAGMNREAEIEEAVIVIADEPSGTVVETVETASAKPDSKSVKDSRQTAKNAKKTSPGKGRTAMPKRRSADSRRKGTRQSVTVGYKVLLFESEDELKASDEAFKGLTPVASFRENNRFKYTYGESADRGEMEALLDQIETLFPDARVIKCYY